MECFCFVRICCVVVLSYQSNLLTITVHYAFFLFSDVFLDPCLVPSGHRSAKLSLGQCRSPPPPARPVSSGHHELKWS